MTEWTVVQNARTYLNVLELNWAIWKKLQLTEGIHGQAPLRCSEVELQEVGFSNSPEQENQATVATALTAFGVDQA